MKHFYAIVLISSILLNPGLVLAQQVDTTQVVVDQLVEVTVEPITVTIIEEIVEPVAEPILISEPEIVITENPIVVTLKPSVGVENPALDVTYCGNKFIYESGTYDAENKPVKAPICTTYDVRYASYATVDFGKSDDLPVHHFEVHNDGKIVFTEKMNIEEVERKIIQGETDKVYYMVSRNEIEQGITLLPEYIVKSYLGENYKDKVIYFDDSIVYSYKIVN